MGALQYVATVDFDAQFHIINEMPTFFSPSWWVFCFCKQVMTATIPALTRPALTLTKGGLCILIMSASEKASIYSLHIYDVSN